MKKVNYLIILFLIASFSYVGCNKKEDIAGPPTDTNLDFSKVEIQDFIWQGMNLYYLWKGNVDDLNNSIINDDEDYFNLLNFHSNPEDFFESLIYQREHVDKWSWIVDDYVALENSFQGISTSNGVEFRLSYESDSNTDVFGYVRYILPNSDASGKDVQRGYIFDAINGQQLTINNYQSLLGLNSYTMNFADLNMGNPISNGKSVELTKSEYQENPVFINKTFDVGGKKIGYLMYNSFTSTFDVDLNAAFGELKGAGTTDLILDLRYNGGGSVRTATYLAGMITGQFNGKLFTKEKWNYELQAWFEQNHPDWLVNNFTDEIYKTDGNGNVLIQEALNSLNLSNLVVITTGSSASASELIINGLNPYIDVITIGTTTAGKYTASVTLYDSENFNKENVNPNHSWAMQPIVLEEINKNGVNRPDGFAPNIEAKEYISEFFELGNEAEPLLARALTYITGESKPLASKVDSALKLIHLKEISKIPGEMYIEKELPADFIRMYKHEN